MLIWLKKTQSKKPPSAAFQYGNIFPLATLLLAGCSPAEPTSSWDSVIKIVNCIIKRVNIL
jgi:hypothetical protein